MARIVNEVRESILAKMPPIKKTLKKETTKDKVEVVGIKKIIKK